MLQELCKADFDFKKGKGIAEHEHWYQKLKDQINEENQDSKNEARHL